MSHPRTRTPYRTTALVGLLSFVILQVGCATKPPRTGFISDYSQLTAVDDYKARYIAPELKGYDRYMVDPIEIRRIQDPPRLNMEERAEVAKYFRNKVIESLNNEGFDVVDDIGVGTARVRLAITDVNKSTWWLNLHPASKLSGVGTGGAAMEGEVIDSITGDQLAAVVQSGRGNQFELDHFDGIDDIKDVIDRWAEEAMKQLRALHDGQPISAKPTDANAIVVATR